MVIVTPGADDVGSQRVVRRASVAGSSGASAVQVDLPAALVGDLDDVDGFAGLGLWPAILAGTNLHLEAPISPGALAGVRQVCHVLRSWAPAMWVPSVSAAEVRPLAHAPGPGVAAYFSRGVDSMYEAALDASMRPPLSHLVFVDGLEPRHSPAVAAAEVAQATKAAEALGLTLAVVRTDAHALTGQGRDWADVHGTVLASLATLMGGEVGEVVIPSTDSWSSLVPYGSHPLVDPLLSTGAVRVRHGDIGVGRAGKVAAIARQRPDLLGYLKVCYSEDRVDNCGRCGKCLITMAALEAVGALEAASGFPDEIDVAEIAAMRPAPLQSRWHWVDVVRLLDETGRAPELRTVIVGALRAAARPPTAERLRLRWQALRGARPSADPSWKDPARGLDWAHHTESLRMLTEGRSGRFGHRLPEPPDRLRAR